VDLELTLKNICKPCTDVVTHEIEGNMLIIPLVGGIGDADREIYTLSETGRAIWHKLDGKKTLGQIAAELAESFSYPREKIERDVLGIVTELIRLKICLKLNGKQIKQKLYKGAVFNNEDIISTDRHDYKTSNGGEPSNYITSLSELCLSNPGQLALLKSMAERGVPLRTTVRGFSMHPFIMDQDVLTISPLNKQQPRLGEVVAFRHPVNGKLVIHRIIKRTGSGWVVRGDNRPEPDGFVPGDNIIGCVTRIERKGCDVNLGLGIERKWIAFLSRGKGLFYLKLLCSIPHRVKRLIMTPLSRKIL
jgi:signal peptidase I